MKKPKKYKLSPHEEERYMALCAMLPIIWHETTPKNFSCEPGCCCCCSAAWFTEEEFFDLSSLFYT